MANEYKLSYTAKEVDEKLTKIDNLALKNEVPTKTSELSNNSGFITGLIKQNFTEEQKAQARANIGAMGEGGGSADITVDSTPTSGSNNPVSSGGVYNALSGKQATITGGASTITSSNLTTSRALISDDSGKVAVSNVTSTELNYLEGVNSNVQTQLNNKTPTSRTINGKSLSSNITLSASDIGAMPNVAVTTSNNGAFLRVVDGKWTAVVLPNAEEGEF